MNKVRIERWDDDDYIITIDGIDAKGPTLSKRDADIVKYWLENSGLNVLISTALNFADQVVNIPPPPPPIQLRPMNENGEMLGLSIK